MQRFLLLELIGGSSGAGKKGHGVGDRKLSGNEEQTEMSTRAAWEVHTAVKMVNACYYNPGLM